MARTPVNARAVAARICSATIFQNRALEQALESHLHTALERDRALVHELSYGVVRWWHSLSWISGQLLSKPLPAREQEVQSLLAVGLYQLRSMDIPDHAAVNETVAAVMQIGKPWARGLINACLRRFQRERRSLEEKLKRKPALATSHPQWLVDQIQQDWPDHWRAILEANNQRPPLTLRCNRLKISRNQYLRLLEEAEIPAHSLLATENGIIIESSMAVPGLPGYHEGLFSVQDGAAQLAQPLLDMGPNQHILDACSAPGGKLTHLLEYADSSQTVIAVEQSARRLVRIRENLQRLGLSLPEHQLVHADIRERDQWWNGKPFDRILLDAPCTAMGVIRRHPDIKWRRNPEAVREAAALQADILQTLWPTLAPGGKLLYVTCSVLRQENSQQIAHLLSLYNDANLVPLEDHPVFRLLQEKHADGTGIQLLPNDQDMDGFYYACIEKTA